jgi:predicted SAM-dependent methyltransferase
LISRDLKAAYYYFIRYPMVISGWTYRWLLSPRRGTVKVHLGPGQKNYLKGWINVDANFISAKIDVWADLRNRLPFRDKTVDAFYSHHMIEHLPDSLLPFHLKEMHRCLKPGGVVRIGGPNGDMAILKFQANDRDWFPDYPDSRDSMGGKFVNFVFCRGEHLTLLTESYLRELLSKAGFVDIRKCRPRTESFYPAIFEPVLEKEFFGKDPESPDTLIVEAAKP